MPEQYEGAYHVRNVNDENEVISFGFFNGTLNDLMQLRRDRARRRRFSPQDDLPSIATACARLAP